MREGFQGAEAAGEAWPGAGMWAGGARRKDPGEQSSRTRTFLLGALGAMT